MGRISDSSVIQAMEEIKGAYTLNDYIIANRCHIRVSKIWRTVQIVTAILALVPIYNLLHSPTSLVDWFFLPVFLFYATYPYTILPIKARRYFKIQRQLQGDITIRFDDATIQYKSASLEYKINWAYKYLVCKGMLLVYNTPVTFLMIPRRFCGDQEQYGRIVRLAGKLVQQRSGA